MIGKNDLIAVLENTLTTCNQRRVSTARAIWLVSLTRASNLIVRLKDNSSTTLQSALSRFVDKGAIDALATSDSDLVCTGSARAAFIPRNKEILRACQLVYAHLYWPHVVALLHHQHSQNIASRKLTPVLNITGASIPPLRVAKEVTAVVVYLFASVTRNR